MTCCYIFYIQFISFFLITRVLTMTTVLYIRKRPFSFYRCRTRGAITTTARGYGTIYRFKRANHNYNKLLQCCLVVGSPTNFNRKQRGAPERRHLYFLFFTIFYTFIYICTKLFHCLSSINKNNNK